MTSIATQRSRCVRVDVTSLKLLYDHPGDNQVLPVTPGLHSRMI